MPDDRFPTPLLDDGAMLAHGLIGRPDLHQATLAEMAEPEPATPPATPGSSSCSPDAEGQRLAAIDRMVGESVRLWRTLRGMTAEDLARRVGVTMQQIAKYESGVNRVSAGMLYLIARELRVPVSTLFANDTETDQVLRRLLVRRGAAPNDGLQREAVQLAVAFSRIADRGMRKEVLSMIRLISEMHRAPAAGGSGSDKGS
jgi:transcriptional regulator with XRE-family HTH domain